MLIVKLEDWNWIQVHKTEVDRRNNDFKVKEFKITQVVSEGDEQAYLTQKGGVMFLKKICLLNF